MQQVLLRAAIVAAGLILVGEACTSAASPPPTGQAASPSTAPVTSASGPPAIPTAPPTPSSSPLPSASPAPSASAAPGLGGTWNGTWQDVTPDQVSGTFALTWTQSGSTLTGTILVKGTPCLSSATVSGSVNGSTINFGAVSGTHTVVYDGTISGTTMKGTYTAPAACIDAKGTWAATKK
jgi:hypothetical protein